MTCGLGPPCHRLDRLFSTEMKRRTTADNNSLLAWRFAFSILRDRTLAIWLVGPGPRVIGWVTLVRVGRDFLWCLGARAGESSLKRDSPRVQQLRFRIFSNCC